MVVASSIETSRVTTCCLVWLVLSSWLTLAFVPSLVGTRIRETPWWARHTGWHQKLCPGEHKKTSSSCFSWSEVWFFSTVSVKPISVWTLTLKSYAFSVWTIFNNIQDWWGKSHKVSKSKQDWAQYWPGIMLNELGHGGSAHGTFLCLVFLLSTSFLSATKEHL